MQHDGNSTTQKLREKKVSDVLTADKRRLVEVPYTATLAHTMNALVANRVVAVPVAAPPGHWIGAGGSMILESDKQTGAVRKHYIGMVTMLDILAHIAGDDVGGGGDVEERMGVPVSSIIGYCLESLSLWTLNPNTRYVWIDNLTCFLVLCLFLCHFYLGKLVIYWGWCPNSTTAPTFMWDQTKASFR